MTKVQLNLNFWYAPKAELKEKFIAVITYIRDGEKSIIVIWGCFIGKQKKKKSKSNLW